MKFLGFNREFNAIGHGIEFYRDIRHIIYNKPNYTWNNKHKSKLLHFKDIHKGEDCFIIGNGPSLNKMDLSQLNKYFTFGLNKIYLIFKNVNLSLDYHVCVNPFVIQQSIDQFNSINIPLFVDYDASISTIDNHKNIYRLKSENSIGMFQGNIMRPINQGFTVTYVAMQIAYFMGFRRVFLIGMDHNFDQKGKPNETQKMEVDDVNHFDPDYFKGQKWQLADLEGSELHYNVANFVFNRSGRKIINATLGGKLEVFERTDFMEAIKIAKSKT